jgi:ribonucleoside-triphosphate reductase
MRKTMSENIKIPSEIYSRVSGYYRPVNQWNKGKQEEYACRTSLVISNLIAPAPAKELQSIIA